MSFNISLSIGSPDNIYDLAKIIKFYLFNQRIIDPIGKFLLNLACFFFLSSLAKMLCKYSIELFRKKGKEIHIKFYERELDSLNAKLNAANISAQKRNEFVNDIKMLKSKLSSLKFWSESTNDRKSDSIYGQNFLLAGAFLFMQMAVKGSVVPNNLDISKLMFLCMSMYFIIYIYFSRKLEYLIWTQREQVSEMAKVINVIGYYSLIIILSFASVL